jgi:hypothetical protein
MRQRRCVVSWSNFGYHKGAIPSRWRAHDEMELTMKNPAKLGMLALTGAALALGSAALLYQPAYAAPQPDCGPTRQWTCVRPGCPNCHVFLFEGTVCEKSAYEQKTGRVCS